jgi:hypothetical protein
MKLISSLVVAAIVSLPTLHAAEPTPVPENGLYSGVVKITKTIDPITFNGGLSYSYTLKAKARVIYDGVIVLMVTAPESPVDATRFDSTVIYAVPTPPTPPGLNPPVPPVPRPSPAPTEYEANYRTVGPNDFTLVTLTPRGFNLIYANPRALIEESSGTRFFTTQARYTTFEFTLQRVKE